jgi:hypothetical protein
MHNSLTLDEITLLRLQLTQPNLLSRLTALRPPLLLLNLNPISVRIRVHSDLRGRLTLSISVMGDCGVVLRHSEVFADAGGGCHGSIITAATRALCYGLAVRLDCFYSQFYL